MSSYSSNQDFYEKQHIREYKTLSKWINEVRKGLWYITSFSIQKESVGDGYRIVIFCRMKD